MNLVLGLLFLTFAYLTYKVGDLYYRYWYYKKQGIPCLGTPIPLFGSMIYIMRLLKNRDDSSPHPMVSAFRTHYNGCPPSIHCDFRNCKGAVTFSDPALVNEIFVTKNKYFEKHPLSRTRVANMVGNTLILTEGNEQWAQRRKSMSVAFYKEKLNGMLRLIIK